MSGLTKEYLNDLGADYTVDDNGKIHVGGSLDLRGTAITDLGQLQSVGGYLDFIGTAITDLGQLQSVDGSLYLEGTAITDLGQLQSVGGSLDLRGTAITDLGQLQSVGGYLDFIGTAITDLGQLQSVGGSLDLRGTAITDLGQLQSVGGSLYLEGTAITDLGQLQSVGGSLYLEGNINILGATCRVDIIDRIPTILGRWKKRGDVSICKAYYCRAFSPTKPVKRKHNACYVAKNVDHYTHGDTKEQAVSDLNFKVLSETRDKSEIAGACVKNNSVTIVDYRLLTGACESGTRAHLKAAGIDLETTQSLSVSEAVRVSSGGYGHGSFVNELNQAGWSQ